MGIYNCLLIQTGPVLLVISTNCFHCYFQDYTAWCNHYLVRGLYREITPDLRTAVGDGTTLVNLVECLSKFDRILFCNSSRFPL
jgi:hypothetical protein